MESLAISPRTIDEVNRKLDELIDCIRNRPSSFSITAERMYSVLAEVVRIGEWARQTTDGTGNAEQGTLRAVTGKAEGPLREQLNRYRHLLEQLRALLPDFHACLLTERCRLQSERLHIDTADAWARSAGQSG